MVVYIAPGGIGLSWGLSVFLVGWTCRRLDRV